MKSREIQLMLLPEVSEWSQFNAFLELIGQQTYYVQEKHRTHSNHPWWNPLHPDRSVYEELADEYALGDWLFSYELHQYILFDCVFATDKVYILFKKSISFRR